MFVVVLLMPVVIVMVMVAVFVVHMTMFAMLVMHMAGLAVARIQEIRLQRLDALKIESMTANNCIQRHIGALRPVDWRQRIEPAQTRLDLAKLGFGNEI